MTKRVAIMQPYFFPYIGYFQLIACVDQFVIYDNIKYTKKGWINRNRMLGAKGPVTFSLPLKQASDHLNIVERTVAADFDANKFLRRLRAAYAGAPYYAETIKLIERIVRYDDRNLFNFIANSLSETSSFLGLTTPFITSSTIKHCSSLKGQDRVVAICNALDADIYINPQNGVALYDEEAFAKRSIDLQFIFPEASAYEQGRRPFVENLSIIDVMMFNSVKHIREIMISQFRLVGATELSQKKSANNRAD